MTYTTINFWKFQRLVNYFNLAYLCKGEDIDMLKLEKEVKINHLQYQLEGKDRNYPTAKSYLEMSDYNPEEAMREY